MSDEPEIVIGVGMILGLIVGAIATAIAVWMHAPVVGGEWWPYIRAGAVVVGLIIGAKVGMVIGAIVATVFGIVSVMAR